MLLEEAAGITGLHSRRHEAELRLRAAETNLERLDDVMQNMETQLRGLKRQARQATRYRNLSGHIRKAQALLLYLRWTAAENGWHEAQRRLSEADAQVTELTRGAARASAAEAEKAETLPPLRQHEAECAARIHRLSVAQERLDEEERQALALSAEQLQTRVQQITNDATRENEHAQDSTARLGSLTLEQDEIEAHQAAQQETLTLAEERAGLAEQSSSNGSANSNSKRSGWRRSRHDASVWKRSAPTWNNASAKPIHAWTDLKTEHQDPLGGNWRRWRGYRLGCRNRSAADGGRQGE